MKRLFILPIIMATFLINSSFKENKTIIIQKELINTSKETDEWEEYIIY